MTKEQMKQLDRSCYIYEIIDTENFLPCPSKINVYKYVTTKPIKINRKLEINNILQQLKKSNINIIY